VTSLPPPLPFTPAAFPSFARPRTFLPASPSTRATMPFASIVAPRRTIVLTSSSASAAARWYSANSDGVSRSATRFVRSSFTRAS
jgi:hypothetical protein